MSSPNLEGWQILAAWAAITKQTKIAMLVTGNTYRHPAVLANMAARWRAGARGFIFGINPPYDRETLERLIGEVRPRLEQLVH